jgi:hypothetical protein
MSFDALVFRRKTQSHFEDGMKRLIYLTRDLETIFVGPKHKLWQLASEIRDPKFIEIPERDSFESLEQIKRDKEFSKANGNRCFCISWTCSQDTEPRFGKRRVFLS